MARFDVYPNPDGAEAGLLLDVQSDLLDGLNTRMVVPLLPESRSGKSMTRLNPVFTLADQKYVMCTQFMAAIRTKELRAAVGNLSTDSSAIFDALDFLFHGI